MRTALAFLVAAMTFVPLSALAQEEEAPGVVEARAQFARGGELAGEQRFSEAVGAFVRSLELVDRPSTAFNLALCYYALNRHVEAIEVLEHFQATADPTEDAESLADADRMLAHARASVAQMVIEVDPADATVLVDGQALEGGARRTRTVNPGPHVIRVEAEHHAPSLIEVEVEPGQEARRAVQLESTQRQAHLSVDVPDHPSAVIELDGEQIGVGSAAIDLDAGAHEVRVQRSDPALAPWVRNLELAWNERLRLNVSLEDPQQSTTIFEEGAFWGVTLGILGAAAVGVLTGILVTELQPQPNGGSTGVVLVPMPMNP